MSFSRDLARRLEKDLEARGVRSEIYYSEGQTLEQIFDRAMLCSISYVIVVDAESVHSDRVTLCFLGSANRNRQSKYYSSF